jgi:LmbE family N-acetylglucosaminyl deacetylase
VENTWENRLKIAHVLRQLAPRVLILPYWKGRHPDHYTASVLGYEAAFLAGLRRLESAPLVSSRVEVTHTSNDWRDEIASAPHRPQKIIYASLYYDVRPTFVVDVTEQFEARTSALFAYKSQYADQAEGAGIFPAQHDMRERMATMARFYGMLAGVTYAEPFVQKEVGLVEDVTEIPVSSF